MQITKQQIITIMPKADKVVGEYLPVINKYAKEFGLTTKMRMAFFIANVAHESGEMLHVVENLNYSAGGLVRTWPSRFSHQKTANKLLAGSYAYNPQKLANTVYANRMGNGGVESGDGYRFRGRGLFGLTGKDNYKAYNDYLRKGGMVVDLLTDEGANLISKAPGCVKSAMWIASKLNKYADDNNFVAYSGALNVGNPKVSKDKIIGFESRRAYLIKALKAL